MTIARDLGAFSLFLATFGGCGTGPIAARESGTHEAGHARDVRLHDGLGTDSGVTVAADANTGLPGASLGSFTFTYYWVSDENDYAAMAADTTLFQTDCSALAKVPGAFATDVSCSGTGRLTDGRVFNYAGSCACAYSPCFYFTDAAHPWGAGSADRPLVPFRSVAVDPAVVPIGTKLYVKELDGVMMPGTPPWGGFVHDGCVSADDTGGAIKGMHLDYFAALRTAYATLDGKLGLSAVTVFQGGTRCR